MSIGAINSRKVLIGPGGRDSSWEKDTNKNRNVELSFGSVELFLLFIFLKLNVWQNSIASPFDQGRRRKPRYVFFRYSYLSCLSKKILGVCSIYIYTLLYGCRMV